MSLSSETAVIRSLRLEQRCKSTWVLSLAVFERGDEAQGIQDLPLVLKNVGREREEPQILLGGERVVEETGCCIDAHPLALFPGS